MKGGWVKEVTLIPPTQTELTLTLLLPLPGVITVAASPLPRSHFGLVTMEMWVRLSDGRERRPVAGGGGDGALQAAGGEGP